MATRFSAPFVREVSDTGTPLSGAKLYFYASGTSTPQNTYSDAALTVANANPVTADSGGRFGDIFMVAGTYKVVLKTASGATVWTADPVAGATSASAGAVSTAGNLLDNGDFAVWQRPGNTSAADTAPVLDRWYALTQTAALTVGQQSLTEDGQPRSIRLTQPAASAQRIGLAQVVPANLAQAFRSGLVTLSGRVRISTPQAVRYAILEWTGAADMPTADVVNDWTSASYTAGGFFVSTSFVVAAVGSVTPAANTWTALPALTATLSGATQNLLVVAWTEATLTQSATLDFGVMQLEGGDTASAFQRVKYPVDLLTTGGPSGRRNRIINGGMAVDQRNNGAAQTITSTAAFTVDRWRSSSTGANSTGQRVAGSAPSQFRYQFTGAAGVTALTHSQRIEVANSFDLAGKTVTVSFDTANSLLTLLSAVLSYASAADDFTTRTTIATVAVTISPVLIRYSVTFAVPSNATTGLQLSLNVGAQISGTWTVGDAQIEEGPQATPFERVLIGHETLACQRYYYAEDTAAISTGQYGTLKFPATMRAVPTVVLTPISGSLSGTTVGKGGLYTQASTTTGLSYTASAEL